MEKWDLSYDFICIGGGIGGITAALVAHDAGLNPVILEKTDQIGGVAAVSSGQFWVAGNYLEEEEGIEDSSESGRRYLEWYSQDMDPELLAVFCEVAPRAFEFLGHNADVEWQLTLLPDMAWPESPDALSRGRLVDVKPFDGTSLTEPWRSMARFSPTSWFSNDEMYFEMGGHAHRQEWDWERAASRQKADLRFQGSALSSYLAMALMRRDIPVLLNVNVSEIVFTDGRVEGVIADVNGVSRSIEGGRGTLIAVGGYDWNRELRKRFDNQDSEGSRAPESVTGDHFPLTEPLGVEVGSVHRSANYGYPETPAASTESGWQPVQARWQPFYSGFPHAINVDQDGRRFSDESGGHGRALQSAHKARGADAFTYIWAIFDSQYRAKYPIGKFAPGDELPEPFVSAQTLGELADKLGLDPVQLAETVATFNEHAAQGVDPSFGRGQLPWAHRNFGDPLHEPNPNLGTLEEAPFYGVRLEVVGMGSTQAGLRTDSRARVIGADGPIPGLYAAGNSAAWLDIGSVGHGGTSNSRGMTWGYIAAHDAAGVPIKASVAS